MLKLHLPQIGAETKTCKDIIITILSNEQPLSIIEIYNRAKKQHNLGITYQGIRRAVDILCEEGVLSKENRKYSINKKWVIELKGFIDRLLLNSDNTKKVVLFNEEIAKEDYAVYTFNNLYDLDNFWSELILHWVKSLKKGDNNHYFSYYHYGFWFLLNLGKETKLFEEVKKRKCITNVICLKRNPINEWGIELYKKIGINAIFNEGINSEGSTDLNLL